PRIGARFLAAQSWLLALRGEHDAAIEKAHAAEHALLNFLDDRETVRIVRCDLARAAFALGAFEPARAGWEKYLEAQPVPLSQPMAYCNLGRCHEALGDSDAARAAYGKALETGIETHYARQARERLAVLMSPF
ncbi:MAG: tetratricopeptide repeat protein, partial [Armatimonadota bacterium]|nr:tetratricopeptide repeat protein [Armatimonadota bacterium]